MDLISLGIIAGVILVVVGVGWLVDYLKSKNIISPDTIDSIEQVLSIANGVLSSLTIDPKITDKIKLATHIADMTIQYAGVFVEGVNRKQVAYEATIKVLDELKIEVTDEMKTAIDFSLEKAIDLLDKAKVDK